MKAEASMTGEVLRAVDHAAQGRSAHVKDVFEDSRHYLHRQGVDILFRREAVRIFAGSLPWRTLLDIGCGDGTISLQLLGPDKELTLLDLSANMAQLVRQNTPKSLAEQVAVRNEDFMTATFDGAPFDLIVTVGVLAHVESLPAFFEKIRSTLRPGGHVILEFTDCRHAVGRVGRFFDRLKESIAPAKYPTNKLSRDEVFPFFAAHRLQLISTFRYARLPLPLLPRLLGTRLQHRVTKSIFGDAQRNTHAALGNEYICLLRAEL